MLLSETLTKQDSVIRKEMDILMGNLHSQARAISPAERKQVVIELIGSLRANYESIWQLCSIAETHAAPVAALLRSLLDSTISCLAFCKDPGSRSQSFRDFVSILDWKFLIKQREHIGCMLAPDTVAFRATLDEKIQTAEQVLRQCGLPFLKKKDGTTDLLNDAIQTGRYNRFRDRWYPEKREDILNDVHLRWVHALLYGQLSSSVHSDAVAPLVLGDTAKTHVVTCAAHILSIGLDRLVDAIRFNLPRAHRELLRNVMEELAVTPSAEAENE